MHLRTRYYYPQTGRFLSRDPLAGHAADPQTLNRYAYALNDPLLLTDPAGRKSQLLSPMAGEEEECAGFSGGEGCVDGGGGGPLASGASFPAVLLQTEPEGTGVVADGSDVVPGSPNPPGHYTFFPTRQMSLEEFQAKLNSRPWELPGRIRK